MHPKQYLICGCGSDWKKRTSTSLVTANGAGPSGTFIPSNMTYSIIMIHSTVTVSGQTSDLTCKKCDRVASLDFCSGSQKCADDEVSILFYN
jgi:hypothetical protein